MRSVGVRELKERASEIVRRVRNKQEVVDVTLRGEVVARLVPVLRRKPLRKSLDDFWTDLDRLTQEISACWPTDVGGTEAGSKDRRG